jgi:hypothetical protein
MQEALQVTVVALVDVLQPGATLLLVATVLLGVARLLEVARLAGEEAAVAEHQVGAETAVAQLTVVVMEVELPTAAMAHEQPMAEQLHTAALPPMAAEHLTAATMAPALRMAVSTLVTARPPGEAHLATLPSHLVVSRLLLLAHTTHQLQVLMQLLLPVLMAHTRHPHLAALWMLLHQETFRPRRQEILGTSTAQRLLRHRHRVLGNLRRRHRVVRIRDIIEVLKL